MVDPDPQDQLRARRREELERLLFDMGYQGTEALEGWDGGDLDFLRRELGEEDFQALIDRLQEDAPDVR